MKKFEYHCRREFVTGNRLLFNNSTHGNRSGPKRPKPRKRHLRTGRAKGAGIPCRLEALPRNKRLRKILPPHRYPAQRRTRKPGTYPGSRKRPNRSKYALSGSRPFHTRLTVAPKKPNASPKNTFHWIATKPAKPRRPGEIFTPAGGVSVLPMDREFGNPPCDRRTFAVFVVHGYRPWCGWKMKARPAKNARCWNWAGIRGVSLFPTRTRIGCDHRQMCKRAFAYQGQKCRPGGDELNPFKPLRSEELVNDSKFGAGRRVHGSCSSEVEHGIQGGLETGGVILNDSPILRLDQHCPTAA
ncbi:hypothetical protein FQR65_LT20058 [Abscondita terminalis]|nr:hypothetical protein FQR65_LT20058 [Abscondita terminalis]